LDGSRSNKRSDAIEYNLDGYRASYVVRRIVCSKCSQSHKSLGDANYGVLGRCLDVYDIGFYFLGLDLYHCICRCYPDSVLVCNNDDTDK